MKDSNRLLRRALAIGAGTALGLGGFAAATPAFATDSTQPSEADVASLFADPTAGVQAVGTDAAGQVVVVVDGGAPQGTTSAGLQTFAATYNPTIHTVGSALQPYAATDVVGGAGILVGTDASPAGSCSIGFAAWTPDGKPAITTAGHCTDDGNLTRVEATDPKSQPAITGNPESQVVSTGAIGPFTFSHYGGADFSPGAENDPGSYDFAAADVSDAGLTTVPVVTDWSNGDDLSQSGTKITAVGDIDPSGSAVNKSGRTTGHTTSETSNLLIEDGWANIGGRMVHGFGMKNFLAGPGDSGGAVYQGTTAIGMISGGSEDTGDGGFTWTAALDQGLADSGYSIALFIDSPVITTPARATIEPGGAITGTGPAGTTLVVTDANGSSKTTPVDANGNWTFNAPESANGEYAFSVQAVRDFDKSAVVSSSVFVTDEAIAAPTIVSPADGETFAADKAPTAVTGTGIDGATVEVSLNGTVVGTSVVEGGNWSVALSQNEPRSVGGSALQPGTYSVSATQAVLDGKSAAATSTFTVNPVGAPTPTTTPAPGGDDDGGLAVTGADGDIALYGGLAAVVLLIAGAAVYATQRRRSLR